MSKWSEGTVTTNGIRIHYYRTGGDSPPVVINHGAGDDGLCWTHVVKPLENDYDVILPDARGHGKSSTGQGDYTTQACVDDLAGLIEALHLQRPVIGGHSMGADTTLHLAAQQPHLARAIFLEDPPLFLPGEPLFGGELPQGKDLGKLMRQYMLTVKLLPRFMALRMARKNFPAYPEDEILPWVVSKERLSFDFLNSMSLLNFNTPDPLAAFDKIVVPTLLFIGDREKFSIVSVKTAEEVARRNPRVQVVHLDGASHDIRRTRFDGYLPALKEFLAKAFVA